MPTVELIPTNPDALMYLGPTIGVQIGFDPSYRGGSTVLPNLPPDLYPALVDTGAGESCIDADLASALKLIVIDRRWISGVGGRMQVNMYAAQVSIPSLNQTIFGEFAGVRLAAGGQ